MDYFRALVVDDEPDFLETLVNRLQKRNIDTAGAR
ncbi:MAG: response regulator, partial [Syntrophobacteraceae bacterium]|nr:response regulator [Syntrophobacteraceae bacterium]